MPTNATALIVDDDRAIQRLLADALTHEGFSVLVEKDGDWALKSFEKRPVHVVLLDILLPAVNGYEVARKIRALPKGADVPIVFLSGVYRAPAQRKDAIEKYKAVEFLEKPIKLPVLREALRRALGANYPNAEEAKAERDRVEKSDAGIYAAPESKEEVREVERESKEAAAGMPALRGNLKDRAFSALLAEVYRWRSNGALLLRREQLKKIVYFRQGTPYFVKSNLLSECLGKILVREKMISEAECEESLKRMKEKNRQQGTVLIEMGCISPPNLNYALTLQLQAKLFDIFSWPDGEYQFNTKADLPPETVSLDMTCAAVIYEGLRRSHELDQIDALMKGNQSKFVHPAADPLYRFQDAGLDEEELALLNACDGRKTVKTLAALAILTPIDTLRMLLAMSYAQMVEFKAEAAAVAEKPVARPRPQAVPWEDPAPTEIGPPTAPVNVAKLPSLADDDMESTVIDNSLPKLTPPPAPADEEEGRQSTQVDHQAYVPASEKAAKKPSLADDDSEATETVKPKRGGTARPAAASPTHTEAVEVPAEVEEEPAPKKGPRAAKAPVPPPPPVDEIPEARPKGSSKSKKRPGKDSGHIEAPRKTAAASAKVEPKPAAKRVAPHAKSPPPPPVASPPPLPPPLPKRPVSASGAPSASPVVARAAGSLLPELSGVMMLGVSAEERALRERLAGAVAALKKRDYFQVLGVAPDANADQVKQAYFSLAKEYHPDRHYRSASAEVRNLANEIYQLIATAYETLKDPDERDKYMGDLARGIKKDVSDEVSKILAAEGKFQKGEDFLRKKQYKEAHAAFQEAVNLYGEEGEFHAFLGWALFQTDPRSQTVTQQAMDQLESAIRLNPKVDKSYLFLGYIYKAIGRADKAERQFEKAIQCNPDCTEALRELRLLGKAKK